MGGYRGEDKGADWVEKTLGWSVDVVERPKKPAPEKVLMAWAREWAALFHSAVNFGFTAFSEVRFESNSRTLGYQLARKFEKRLQKM